jgi:mycofactocin glycosyltransferase
VTPDPTLPPATLEVRLDPGVLVRDGGRLLCGGTPFRLTRLTPAGARVAADWRTGGTVGAGNARRTLARRLLDAGLLLTAPRAPADAAMLDIIIPTHDRAGELRRCLEALTEHHPGARVLIVDDGSARPHEIAAVARDHGAGLIRHDQPRGPSAARNTGLATTTGPLIAFVDSDVVVDAGCLGRLSAHFADPAIGAAAPRVLALHPDGSHLGRYEARHSSLDMGGRPGTVGPGHPVSYVPSATLMVRREAVPEGFDEGLPIGEDVDFVWRMTATGWRVAYDPAATIRHDHRVQPATFWRRRWTYNYSIGLLARRHPAALPAMYLEPWSAGTIALLFLGRPRSALGLAALRVATLRRKLAPHTAQSTALAAELMAHAVLGTARGTAHAVRRTWSPLLLPAATRSRRARTVLAAAVAFDVIDDRRWTGRAVAIAAADDLVAAAATWASCLEARTPGPLLPRIPSRWAPSRTHQDRSGAPGSACATLTRER